jgi:hypothetical protein
MLPGMRGWMILVERRGGVGTWVGGGPGQSVSGLMTVYRGGVAIEIGGACFRRPRRMSWMVTAEVFLGGPSVGIGINGCPGAVLVGAALEWNWRLAGGVQVGPEGVLLGCSCYVQPYHHRRCRHRCQRGSGRDYCCVSLFDV